MRIRTNVALVLVVVACVAAAPSTASRRLPTTQLIRDLNTWWVHDICRFDFTSVGTDSCPHDFVPLGTDVAFFAVDPFNGFGLWRTDGTRIGTTFVRHTNDVRIFDVIDGNGVIFFSAEDRDGLYGSELWRSDGTAAGTRMVADINPGAAGSQTNSGVAMINAGGTLYFSATDGVSGFELWKVEAGRSVPSTGTPPRPQLVKDIYPGPDHGAPQHFAFTGSTLFFLAQDPDHGFELWKSDGTAEGTVLVKDIVSGPGSSTPHPIVAFGQRVLFSTQGPPEDPEAGSGLWISDGTEAGTVHLKPGLGDANLVVAGTRAFFSGHDPVTGVEMWVTDGTPAGTRPIDAVPGANGLWPVWLAALGENVLFQVAIPVWEEAVAGQGEPWVSDGTVEGTRLLKDIEPGVNGSGARRFTVAGNLAFFIAQDSAHGEEMWVTDGTTDGTRLLKDINRGPASSQPIYMRSIRGVVYFRADDGLHGIEPWKVTP